MRAWRSPPVSLGRRAIICGVAEVVVWTAGGIMILTLGDVFTLPVLGTILGLSVVTLIALFLPEISAGWHRWHDPAARALAAAELDRQEKIEKEKQASDALWEEAVRVAQRHPGYRGVERDPETGTGRLLFAKAEDLIGLTIGRETAVALEARQRGQAASRRQRLWATARWGWWHTRRMISRVALTFWRAFG